MINYFLTRFPILLILCTSLSQIVGTFFTLRIPINHHIIWIFLLFSLLFLFFIRVVDDYKDKEHDNIHYPERAIQNGQINLNILMKIASIGMIFGLGLLCYFFGIITFIFAFLWVLNNLLGIIWFWYGRDYKFKHIFLYSLLNGLSLAFVQLALYSVTEIQPYAYSYVGVLFFLMVFCNNQLLEVARKIRYKWEIKHGDSYMELLGNTKSFHLLVSTVLMITILNVLMSAIIETNHYSALFYSLWACSLIILIWLFQKLQTRTLKYSILFASVVFYVISNLLHFSS